MHMLYLSKIYRTTCVSLVAMVHIVESLRKVLINKGYR